MVLIGVKNCALVAVVLLCCISVVDSFINTVPLFGNMLERRNGDNAMVLLASGNKKRRRRKQAPQVDNSGFDDLPDFDLNEDDDAKESTRNKNDAKPKVSIEESVEDAMSDPAVMAAMMQGSSAVSNVSTKDVLKSRSRVLGKSNLHSIKKIQKKTLILTIKI